MKPALIIVDIQNDFVEGGSLGADGGKDLGRRVASYVKQNHDKYSAIVTTQDWHIDPKDHWSANPDFSTSWPVHCEAETFGAKLYEPLAEALGGLVLNENIDLVQIIKGEWGDDYSGFEGHIKGDNQYATLEAELNTIGVDTVEIVGIATDHCVKATAEQAVEAGFKTTVLQGFVVGIDPENSAELLTTGFANGGINVK